MSRARGKQSVIISREYKNDPDYCVRALEVLLKAPVSKRSGIATARIEWKDSQDDTAGIGHAR